MSLSYPDLTGGSNITVSLEKDEYIILATSNVVYTLPIIICDGMRYVFSRLDTTSNSVTLTVYLPSSNTISSRAGTFTTNIIISSKTIVEIQSYEGVWYVFNIDETTNISTSAFNASFLGNNGRDFLDDRVTTWFPFLGTDNGDIISDIFICAAGTSGSLTWVLSPNIVPTPPISSIPAAGNTPQTYHGVLPKSMIDNLPSVESPVSVILSWINNGSNDERYYSFTLF